MVLPKTKVFVIILIIIFLIVSGIFIFYQYIILKPQQSGNSQDKLSSCVIFEEKYCRKGEIVYNQGKFYGLGFKIPEGTRVYSPFDGSYTSGNKVTLSNKTYTAVSVFQNPTRVISESTIGVYVIASTRKTLLYPGLPSLFVTKGRLIAEIDNEKIDEDYTVILSFRRFNSSTKYIEPDINLSKEFFSWLKL